MPKNKHQTLIDLRQVVKTYTSSAGSFTALRGIDLRIDSGEFVAIVGKSGSGKTTLINVLTGIDRPTHGEVFIANTPVHLLDEGQLAAWRGANLGIVFQFFQLLPTLTILENVRLPMDFGNRFNPAEREERALCLLELVGVAEHANKLPSHLSGGQQQSAAIARALANDPKILVTDEPTGNLDSRTAEQVFTLLANLAGDGKTILMVTHDDDLAKRASRVVMIKDGEIVS
ncbi:MAG: ABC transporter ATP-binding protein [Chloroflexi bacterium RBG_16_57_11]|nr:MAG: ABC transporter ATP-binding protein [Chloroflexi bacterium RBG_16_57_11]